MTKDLKFKLGWKGLCTEHRTSKHVHAGRRPGAPAPVMIQRNATQPNLGAANNTAQSAFRWSIKIRLNSTYFGLLRVRLLYHVPGAVFPVKIKDPAKTFGWAVFLPFKLRQFSWTNLQNCLLWTLCLFWKKGHCVSQDITLPKYYFGKVLFCQNIILPKYHVSAGSVLPKYHFAKVLFCQNIMLPHFRAQMPALIDSIEIMSIPLQHLRIILRGFRQVTSQGRWSHWNHHPL